VDVTANSTQHPSFNDVPESAWFKSSYSGANGGNCVEVAFHVPEPAWFKSSYSGQNGGNCVEVAPLAATVHVRDSKDKQGGALSFTLDAWTAFAALAACGQVDFGVVGG
jgi:hypothetical protein